ncbi:MAG TPA: DUF2306 domain-containing protein [Candidatus Acidoferrum sp.]|jgi:uncharacterized membrane protein
MEPSSRLRRVLWTGVIFLAVIGVAVAVRRMVVLLPVILHGYRPPPPPPNPVAAQFVLLDDFFAHYPILTLIHIIPGLLFMISGPFQFSAALRTGYPKFHRVNGRIFLVCAAIVGVSALVMSVGMPAIGGVNQAAATTLFATFFLFALGKAFRHILRREIALHREWMIRAFGTGLAVATIRPIIGFFFATRRITGLTPHEFFGTAFWLGFTLQLIALEAWIQYTRPHALPDC